MKIIDLNEDTLKDLIFEHLLLESHKCKYSEDYFSFHWNEDKTHIVYEDVDLIVYGNSCWEDSKEEKKNTQCSSLNDNSFGEFFDSFLIPSYILHTQFEKNCTDEYLKYLDTHKSEYDYHCFIWEQTRQEEEDCYYNYSRVRTLTIRVNEILDYLKNISFHKELEEISTIFTNISKENLQPFALYSHLDNTFPEKQIQTKKKKI